MATSYLPNHYGRFPRIYQSLENFQFCFKIDLTQLDVNLFDFIFDSQKFVGVEFSLKSKSKIESASTLNDSSKLFSTKKCFRQVEHIVVARHYFNFLSLSTTSKNIKEIKNRAAGIIAHEQSTIVRLRITFYAICVITLSTFLLKNNIEMVLF